MNDKLIISEIINSINYIDKLTKEKDFNEFKDSLGMETLLNLILEINKNINRISFEFKNEHPYINWTIIANEINYDQVSGSSISIESAWELATIKLIDDFLEKLVNLLNNN